MANSFGAYKRVFLLGVDGMGAFNKVTDTPNMDRIFANGATTYTALASKPTISAQCWTSILTGATPEVHKLTNGDMHPIDELPTIFKFIKDKYPEAETAAFTGWPAIAKQIITPERGLSAFDVGHDGPLCDRLLEYLDEHDPKMLFVQFDSVDGTGHDVGYGAEKYLEAIRNVDNMFGKIIEKYEKYGRLDDTLVLVTADHGGTPGHDGHGGGHGGWTDAEKLVFLGIAGKTVKNGQIGEVCIRDIPEIVLYALGVDAPEFNPKGYASQMPVGVFEEVGVVERKQMYPAQRIYDNEGRPQPEKDSSEYIGNFIDENKIIFWQDFENGIEDATGKCKVTLERGTVKTYNNGFVGKSGELGNSVVRIEGLKASEVFSFAFWYFPTTDMRWLDIFSNKDGDLNKFTIAPFDELVGIFIKKPDGDHIKTMMINASETAQQNTWTHYIFEVDTVKNEVRGYVNFQYENTLKLDFDIAPYFSLEPMRQGLNQSDNEVFYKVFDDIMIIDGPAEPEKLEKYYTNK
ncbi:MAG: alkaline phosphatase family protein [Clostridia bacterium]|nr:alkaline phosphatase family protein [Clostridia bacterium]